MPDDDDDDGNDGDADDTSDAAATGARGCEEADAVAAAAPRAETGRPERARRKARRGASSQSQGPLYMGPLASGAFLAALVARGRTAAAAARAPPSASGVAPLAEPKKTLRLLEVLARGGCAREGFSRIRGIGRRSIDR